MKNFTTNYALMALFLASATFLSGCGKDEDHHHPAHEQELITTVKLNVIHPTDTTKNLSIMFRDTDGEGGLNGVITPDTLRLLPNTTYRAYLQLLDESDNGHTADMAEEVREESTSHQFFYEPSQSLSLTVSNLDLDTNLMPLGLEADITTVQPGAGSLRISLNHYDGVAKDGTNPSGETDIEVNFPVRIQQ